jgi:cobalamin biosynthesis Co2+ chelatase CbiK
MANIDLPQNGKLWKDIRSENYAIPEDILSNIEDNKQFLELIKQMISPISKRPTLIELIHGFPELKKRYDLLKNKKYKK